MNNTLVKQMANPWARVYADDDQAENMLKKVEEICSLKDIIAIDLSWEFKDTNKLWQQDELEESIDFIGEAKAYLGDSKEQIAQQFIKMDFDYIIDRHQRCGEADVWGTIWLSDGSWIDVYTREIYDNYEENTYANYELKKLPIPPMREKGAVLNGFTVSFD